MVWSWTALSVRCTSKRVSQNCSLDLSLRLILSGYIAMLRLSRPFMSSRLPPSCYITRRLPCFPANRALDSLARSSTTQETFWYGLIWKASELTSAA
jgi:hypothetical protein